MKIRLVDKSVYEITRAEIISGRFEIDFADKTAEEVQGIFSVPANLGTIELLTDEDGLYGIHTNWTKYSGVMLNGNVKTAILTQPADVTEERVTAAEANALAAKTATEDQAAEIEQLKKDVEEGGAGVDQELFAATAVVARANFQALPDIEAVEAKALAPEWDPNGVLYPVNYKVTQNDVLYKCLQEHTSQPGWAPGVAPSLWTAIESGEHAGTLEDPIPVPETVQTAGMEYEKGKYYSEGGTVYLMDRQGMEAGEKVTLYFAPSALVGQYFSLVEE